MVGIAQESGVPKPLKPGNLTPSINFPDGTLYINLQIYILCIFSMRRYTVTTFILACRHVIKDSCPTLAAKDETGEAPAVEEQPYEAGPAQS